jgi:hypothetical protein
MWEYFFGDFIDTGNRYAVRIDWLNIPRDLVMGSLQRDGAIS